MSLRDQLASFKQKVSSQAVDLKPRVSSLGRGPLGLKRTTEDRIREQAEKEAQEKRAAAKLRGDDEQESDDATQNEPEPIAFRLSLKYEIINMLKDDRSAKSLQEISQKCGVDISNDSKLIEDLKINPKITFNESSNTFEFKPTFNVETADQLYELTKERYYLNIFKEDPKTPIGIDIKELEDAPVDVKPLVNELIASGKILVIRGKEDAPKVIFYNEYTEPCDMDKEFRDVWLQIKTPGETDLKNALKLDGLKAMDVFERKQIVTDKPAKKARKSNANMKKTNTHMTSSK
ncbi:transcription factor TFIIE beta subunit, TFIIEB, Tfa2 [Entomophthora muscae]|uniref:Transcription factor TFIIE beta subunit, TFIIEB, Tfa2 n=1 Tax=Entomophthora muscae TaxID=34485 RepID=A0ACC2SN66_9FUNG|nr:transcription factor TFIIE beta subunit, TFIIEB, Tfa2 [Entomophthora muscae]